MGSMRLFSAISCKGIMLLLMAADIKGANRYPCMKISMRVCQRASPAKNLISFFVVKHSSDALNVIALISF